MPFEFWRATGTYELFLPDRAFGYAVLLLYTLLLLYLLYQHRQDFTNLSRAQRALAGGLWVGAFLFSQLFPIRYPLTLTPFIAVPFLLAGALLNPGAALVAGICAGFGQALAESHQYFDIFHYGFVAWLAAIWLRQNFAGRLYALLRQPVLSGSAAMGLMTILVALAAYANTDSTLSGPIAFDLALVTANSQLWPLVIEGFFGGLIVTLILIGAHDYLARTRAINSSVVIPYIPRTTPARRLVSAPEAQSIRSYLLNRFMRFAILLVVLLVVVLFNLAASVATRLVLNQMAHDAQAVSAEIPAFQARLQNALTQYSEGDNLLSSDTAVQEKYLRQLFRTNPEYRSLLLVQADGTIVVYPDDDTEAETADLLTEMELAAVANARDYNAPGMTSGQSQNEEHILSFVVPVHDAAGNPAAVLVGRVPELSLDNLIIGLQGTVGAGSGYIVDEHANIIAHPNPERLLTSWYTPQAELGSEEARAGVNYLTQRADTQAREMVYYLSGTTHPWTVVITVPYAVVLELAWNISMPLAAVLVATMVAFYFNLAAVGREITEPLRKLVQASKTIAAGGGLGSVPETAVNRDDEVGQLNQAFTQMQRSLKNRLDELSLLLSVSHDVSASIDINHGIPAILKGALRGTGASGARAIVFNPSGGPPITFGEGPAARRMSPLDRAVATRLRNKREVTLATPAQIQQELELPGDAPIPVRALIAIALQSRDRLQGVLWLGYRQPHRFTPSERNLLQTLSSQASILVENARLFATAEGGWRRLAAVLASTTDAVIVTDQTNRVLLINRAMERIFNLNAADVIGRQVPDVLTVAPLARALTQSEDSAQHQEFSFGGRVYYTNASPIISNDGQALGRVAVLHDITHYKEVDALKTDFVSTVSHDLRSPLTYMRGYATMLPMIGEMNDRQQQYTEKILNGIDQMAQLVDDLLDLGRIEAGVEVDFNRIDLKPLLQDIAQEYWQHTHLNGIKLDVQVSPELPPIYGDQALIRQAITNYIGNGIKYAPNSGKMTLRAEAANGEVVISVKDNGPGISRDAQMRLFEKFYRAQQRGTEKIKGSGLGLAIVKSIAERHGGRAWCQSELGKGSTFYLSVPLAR